MDILIPLILSGVVATIVLSRHTRSEPAWQLVAKRLGLEYRARGLLSVWKIHGELDGVRVRVEGTKLSSAPGGTGVLADFTAQSPRIAADVAMTHETVWTTLDIGGEEIRVDDARLDEAVSLRGHEGRLLALLDQGTRNLLVDVVAKEHGTVRDGKIHYQTSKLGDEADVTARIKQLVALANSLVVTVEDIPRRIAKNAEEDGLPTVRRRNLEFLRLHYRRSDWCTHAARVGIEDGDPEVRLVAARILGNEAATTLGALVRSDKVDQDIRMSALDVLAETGKRDALETTIAEVLRGRSVLLMRVAVQVAQKIGLQDVAPQVLALTSHVDAGLAATAAAALGAIGDSSHERRLLALLGHEDDDVRTASCESLGAIGTLEAVEPLLGQTSGVFKNTALKNAARTAVAAIQARVDGGDGGRLSVVKPKETGELSVTNEAGNVAIVEEE